MKYDPCAGCMRCDYPCDRNQNAEVSESGLIDLLSGKVGKVDKYRSRAGTVNLDYDMARVVIDLTLPEDNKLYQLFKQLAT